jgi:microcystin-dependent protein
MTEPFLGEITMFAGNFAPRGWALCNGTVLPIRQNTALFSIIGVNYGGDGQNTFALPNLMGASPMHQGQGPGLTDRTVGESGGSSTVTLFTTEMPAHTHRPQAVAARGNRGTPTSALWAQPGVGRLPEKAYTTEEADGALSAGILGLSGGSASHNNRPPYLAVTFIIALEGIFPSRP